MTFFDPPVDQGKVYEVTIDAQGNKGDGIAHIESFVVFVKGAKAGEKLKIRITAVHRTFALGEVVK